MLAWGAHAGVRCREAIIQEFSQGNVLMLWENSCEVDMVLRGRERLLPYGM